MDEYYKKVSFKEIIYDDISELEKAIKTKNELIKILIDLKDEHTHQRELKRLELKFELSKEKLLDWIKKLILHYFFKAVLMKLLLQNLILTLIVKGRSLKSKNLKKELKE